MQITRGGFAIVVPKGPTTTQDPLLREVRPKLSSHRGEPENCHVGSLANSSATATDPEVNRHQSPAARHTPLPEDRCQQPTRGRPETAPNVDRSNGVARIVALSSGCSSAWQSAAFGTQRSQVQILSSRLEIKISSSHSSCEELIFFAFRQEVPIGPQGRVPPNFGATRSWRGSNRSTSARGSSIHCPLHPVL